MSNIGNRNVVTKFKLDVNAVRQHMLDKSITIEDLAYRMGLSRQGAYYILRQATHKKAHTIFNLAKALGVNPTEIVVPEYADDLEILWEEEKNE